MVVLIDANVILDYLVAREPFYNSAKEVIELCSEGKVKGYVAFHTISNIFFILRKVCDTKIRRDLLKHICTILTVTGASHARVCDAINRDDFVDFEDCLQDECAEEINAKYIITRNVQDFSKAKVTAIEPDSFLNLIKGNTFKSFYVNLF